MWKNVRTRKNTTNNLYADCNNAEEQVLSLVNFYLDRCLFVWMGQENHNRLIPSNNLTFHTVLSLCIVYDRTTIHMVNQNPSCSYDGEKVILIEGSRTFLDWQNVDTA